MKKYKFFTPYQKTGRTTFPDTQNKSGVYLIKENEKVVYIGMSTVNLYKTMYRHFEAWRHRTQEVVSYRNKMASNRYTVRVVLCTALQSVKLERALIKKHRPRDNENKYSQYEITVSDTNLVQAYESTGITDECPF